MIKILFVDDEPAILEALEDSLRLHRHRWKMTFSEGGEAAILQLSQSHFDVVVSDVRMPDVDGLGVLEYAKNHHPNAIRIALTGYSDNTSTIELTRLAQRYLTKPCSVDDLDEAIHRDSGLIEAFDNPVVQELAGSAGRLPSQNKIQEHLLTLLNTSEVSCNEIAAIIESDPAIMAKILQLANSSFFRRQATIVSAQHAVAHLGLDVIKSMLLANKLFEFSECIDTHTHFNIETLREHSVLCSSIGQAIAPNADMASVAFTAGLLHDVGKIIVAIQAPELLEKLISTQNACTGQWVTREQELDILGCTHAEVGGYFLNLWGIPTPVVEAVTFHDMPSLVHTKTLDAVGIVHLANYLAYWLNVEHEKPMLNEKLDSVYMTKLNLESKLDEWKSTIDSLLYSEAA